MQERMEAIVYGRVQMVMYRDFAQRKARRLRLVGEVENMRDGTVRVVAEGPRAALERYLALLYAGSWFARVEHVEHVWKAATGEYAHFSIIY